MPWAQCTEVNFGAKTGDHACGFKLAHAFIQCGLAEMHTPAQFGQAQAGIGLQLGEQAGVIGIQVQSCHET
jgi:hypothetical protein